MFQTVRLDGHRHPMTKIQLNAYKITTQIRMNQKQILIIDDRLMDSRFVITRYIRCLLRLLQFYFIVEVLPWVNYQINTGYLKLNELDQ